MRTDTHTNHAGVGHAWLTQADTEARDETDAKGHDAPLDPERCDQAARPRTSNSMAGARGLCADRADRARCWRHGRDGDPQSVAVRPAGEDAPRRPAHRRLPRSSEARTALGRSPAFGLADRTPRRTVTGCGDPPNAGDGVDARSKMGISPHFLGPNGSYRAMDPRSGPDHRRIERTASCSTSSTRRVCGSRDVTSPSTANGRPDADARFLARRRGNRWRGSDGSAKKSPS
jgi:hypothetical protein